ncbi:MAG: hypothetical protein F6K11_18940 [Leptolyngbya sp. SIO3F4]|nr:hypothetical protein [Leptolyngbya sp. SIO3F4]
MLDARLLPTRVAKSINRKNQAFERSIFQVTNNLGLYLPEGNSFKLPIAYRRQLDNTGFKGYRECCLTSNTMAIDYVTRGRLSEIASQKGYREPEDAYAVALKQYGDTTIPQAHIPTAAEFGVKMSFKQNLSYEVAVEILQAGYPLVAGVDYKDVGHYVCFAGIHKRAFYTHDPYGERDGASDRYLNHDHGEYDFYSRDLLNKVWLDLGPAAGWGFVIYEVDGVKTEIAKFA